MLERVKRIIAREKINHPSRPAIILLIQRLIALIDIKKEQIIINYRKDGTFSSQKDLFMCSLFPKKVLDIIILELKPSSILDIGCGTGVSLMYYLNNNIDALGVENSAIAIAQSPAKEKILKHNLNKELNLQKQFDLVWSFEVIEHIHPDYEFNFLKTLTNHSNRIILSAARPGQGGHGHFNEQEPEYWIKKFNLLGYKYESELSEKLKKTEETHAENLLCFKKSIDLI